MDDNVRHPDTPTEPPDMPKGRRGQGGEVRVKTSMSGTSRECGGGTGDEGGDEHRPGKPTEPPDEPQLELRDRRDVQVETGEVERHRSVAHRSADAVDDGEAAEEAPQVEGPGKSVMMRRETSIAGERECASGHIRSTRADEENDQHTETGVDDVPEEPPEPPPPPSSPPTPSAPQNEPPSVELEGEWRILTSHNVKRTERIGSVRRQQQP